MIPVRWSWRFIGKRYRRFARTSWPVKMCGAPVCRRQPSWGPDPGQREGGCRIGLLGFLVLSSLSIRSQGGARWGTAPCHRQSLKYRPARRVRGPTPRSPPTARPSDLSIRWDRSLRSIGPVSRQRNSKISPRERQIRKEEIRSHWTPTDSDCRGKQPVSDPQPSPCDPQLDHLGDWPRNARIWSNDCQAAASMLPRMTFSR